MKLSDLCAHFDAYFVYLAFLVSLLSIFASSLYIKVSSRPKRVLNVSFAHSVYLIALIFLTSEVHLYAEEISHELAFLIYDLGHVIALYFIFNEIKPNLTEKLTWVFLSLGIIVSLFLSEDVFVIYQTFLSVYISFLFYHKRMFSALKSFRWSYLGVVHSVFLFSSAAILIFLTEIRILPGLLIFFSSVAYGAFYASFLLDSIGFLDRRMRRLIFGTFAFLTLLLPLSLALMKLGAWLTPKIFTRIIGSDFPQERLCHLVKLIVSATSFIVSMIAFSVLFFFRSGIWERFRQTEKNQSELIIMKMFKSAMNPMMVFRNGSLVQMNPSVEKFLGFSFNELHGRLFQKAVALPRSVFESVLHTDGINYEINVFPKEQPPFQALAEVNSIRIGKEVHSICVFQNVGNLIKEKNSAKLFNSVYRLFLDNVVEMREVEILAKLLEEEYPGVSVSIDVESAGRHFISGLIEKSEWEEIRTFLAGKGFFKEQISQRHQSKVYLKIRSKDRVFGFMRIVLPEDRFFSEIQEVFTSVAGLFARILERQELIGALSLSEKNYRDLIEFSPFGILIYQEKKIIFANRVFSEMISIPLAKIMDENTDFLKLFGEVQAEQLLNLIDPTSEEKSRSFCFQREISRGSPYPHYFEVFASHIVFSGKPAVLFHMHDMTEKKRIEAQKERLTELLMTENKMNALYNLVSGISHEFNNLFAIIQGYTQLLQIATGNKTVEVSEELQIILDSVGRGVAICERLQFAVDVTRSGMMLINLTDTVVNAVDVLRIQEKIPKRVNLQILILSKRIFAFGNEAGVHKIVEELLMNALDATLAAPEANIIITLDATKDLALLSVEDNGIGMDEHTKENATDPFFTMKGDNDRTGLGLYLVHEITRQFNGDLEIETVPGKRTAVKLSFKLQK